MAPLDERHSPHLDALRIVASIAIVVMHYVNYAKDYRVGRLLVDHLWHFNLFVDLFFVISGFVIAGRYLEHVADRGSIWQFLCRRFARIYPLHIATFAFYLAIAVAFHLGYVRVDNAQRYPWSDIPAQILLLHAVDGARLTFNYPSWSLSAEMVCYCAFPLLALMTLRRPASIVGLALGLIVALTLYSALTGVEPWPQWINKGGAVRALPGFCLGISFYVFRSRIGRLRLRPALFTAAFAIFVAVGWALDDVVALAVVYLIALLAVACDQTGARTLFTRLGLQRWAHLTYSSYMLHMPVATIVVTVLGRFIGPHLPAAPFVLIAVSAGLLAPASVACYRYFEDPMRRRLGAAFDKYLSARPQMTAVAARGRG